MKTNDTIHANVRHYIGAVQKSKDGGDISRYIGVDVDLSKEAEHPRKIAFKKMKAMLVGDEYLPPHTIFSTNHIVGKK